jgi:hypothetical protein
LSFVSLLLMAVPRHAEFLGMEFPVLSFSATKNMVLAVMAALLLALLPPFESTSASASGTTWSTPVDLSAAGQNAFRPQVAVDGSGNLIAVWERDDGDNEIIQASTSTNGGVTWSTPVNLSAAGQNASDPQLTVDGSANVTAVWARSDGSNPIIQASTSTNGGVTWSTPVDLSAAGASAFNPQVAVDGSGNLTAVWRRADQGFATIQAATSTDGGATWSTPVDLSAANQNAFNPQVAVDGSGNLTAVWSQDVGSDGIIQASRSTDGGVTWSTPVNLSAAGQNASDPQLTVDGSANVTAVWARDNGSNPIIQASTSTNGGVTWSTPVNVSAGGQDAFYPQVTVDGSGNLTAVWYRPDGFNFIVQASTSTDGGATWSTPVDLSAAGASARDPQVTVDGSGNLTAVWEREDGLDIIVQAARSTDGGVTWSTPVDLSAAGQNASDPQLTVDGSANVTAVWARSDGSNPIIQASSLRFPSSSASSPEQDPGVPGIFLAVNGVLVGKQVAGAPVYFGADRVAVTSSYRLTVTAVSNVAPSVVTLAEGTIDADGSFSSMVRLPGLAPGTYNIRMTGQHSNGATLELTSQVTVDAGVLSSVGANIPIIR